MILRGRMLLTNYYYSIYTRLDSISLRDKSKGNKRGRGRILNAAAWRHNLQEWNVDNCLIILVAHFPRKSIVFLSGEPRNELQWIVPRGEGSVGFSNRCCDISRAKIILQDNEFSRAAKVKGEGRAAFPPKLVRKRRNARIPRIARPER